MKKRLTKLTAMLLAGMMVLSLVACGGKEEAAAPTATESAATETVAGEKVLTAAISTAWDTMMPLNTTSNYTRMIADQIYDRLTQTTADGEIQGRLAESSAPEASTPAMY